MNQKRPANQLSKAGQPSNVQPSKAVVPTGQNSTTTPATQNKKDSGFAVIGILQLPKEEIEKLLKTQVPQQSTTINVQNNTQIINNYYFSPPEAQNLGQQGGSQDRLHQGPQTTAPTTRAIEDKAHGVDTVPSALKSTQKNQETSQNGSGDKVNSSRPTKVQTRPIQDRSRVEASSARNAKPTPGQVPSKPAQVGTKKPESATVLAIRVPAQARREASQPKSSQVGEFFHKIRHPDPPREDGSRPKKTAPTSTTTPPARESNRNHPSGSREDPAVKQPQSRAKPQATPHHSQAPSESRGRTAPEQPVLRSQHQGSQLAKREEPAGVAHGHPAVTKSEDHGAGAVPEVPKELSEKDIRKYLDDLDSQPGNPQGTPQMGTGSVPTRLILLGKASAKLMGLKTDQKVYHIDVMLEGGERLEHVRQCMKRMRVFREFDRPEQDTKKASESFIFGTDRHRAVVFNEVARDGECISGKKQHLKVYLMNRRRAFEFELRRMKDQDPGSDKHKESLTIAEAILWSRIERGSKPLTLNSCRTQRLINSDYDVPKEPIEAVAERFKSKHGKPGIVDT